MTQLTHGRRQLKRFLAAFSVIAIAAASARGAAPAPVIAYDFSRTQADVVKAIGNSALDLRVGKARDSALVGGKAALPVSPEKASAWLSSHSPDEFSAAFWIRFDKLPSQGTPIGLFDLKADKEGFLTLRLFAQPDDFLGDFEMRSREPVKKGEWHHVEFTYSKIQWRASLYIDGLFQWENDNLHLPSLRYGPLVLGDGFRGALRDIRFYDMALPSECLAIADGVPEKSKDLAARAKALAAKASNGHLRGWIASLVREADSMAAAPSGVTIQRLKELKLDIDNAAKVVHALSVSKKLPGKVMDGPATVYTVKPLTQELFLPKTIPENGSISGEMRLVASPGEYESGSALVFAFRPTEVRKVVVSDLRGPNGSVIPSKEIDVKLVKRWFRTGGAWLSYHSDRRQRNLTPDLLIYDDDLVRVDEWRRRNYLRFDYPEGRRYEDVSDPAKGHISWRNDVPLRDAKSLQPVKIPEAGRNQQFYFTVHVPEKTTAGLYRGRIAFEGAESALDLVVRVVPIDLPTQPAPYHDLDKTFLSHMNWLPDPVGPTVKDRETYMKEMLAHLRSHNLFHATGLWDSDEHVALARAAGFVPDKIFGTAAGGHFPGVSHTWFDLYPGIPRDELTEADKEAALACLYRKAAPWRAYFKGLFTDKTEPYVIFYSETRAFDALNTVQAERAEFAHMLGQKVFAHGWYANSDYAGDIQDMNSITYLDDAEEASEWHAAGGELISYSDTFPGSENPYWFRRRIGLRTYKAGYDGQMLHGFLAGRIPWNEFAQDGGGDGNYRNFRMLFPQQDGFISKLAFEGYREAFDDLRYATRLRQLALANIDSKDESLRRECRRQLLWLEQLDGKTADLDMARYTMIDGICPLQELIRSRKGVLPPADKVATR